MGLLVIQVPFQPNNFDCGVHALWHLKHIIKFGLVEADCEMHSLKFSQTMIGQHLSLAQEILDDSGL